MNFDLSGQSQQSTVCMTSVGPCEQWTHTGRPRLWTLLTVNTDCERIMVDSDCELEPSGFMSFSDH